MSKKILIVESDTALSAAMRQALEARGFSVDETSDGKGSVEQVRRDRPDLVVLAVELAAGQNGYLLCGKLKKDDELKALPVIILGSPDGFAQHRKLKTHADDYLAKPLESPEQVVERVGALIGLPDPGPAEVVEEEALTLTELDEPLADEPLAADALAEEAPALEAAAPEEISLSEEATVQVDPELDLLDAAFEDLSPDGAGAGAPATPAGDEAEGAAGEPLLAVEELSPLEGLGAEAESALDTLGLEVETPSPAPPPPAAAPPPPPLRPTARPATPSYGMPSVADVAEQRSLRARVAELQSALDEAQAQAGVHETRVRELEAELEGKAAELEAARASAGKGDRDTFALREAANRKDKELLRLKSELHEREQELLELRDRLLQLEQQTTESSGEIARRDAQLKTLGARVEALGAERKRMEAQLAAAREEARGASARLDVLQAEADQALSTQATLQAELEALRAEADARRSELEAARAEAEAARGEAEAARGELEALRARADQAGEELEAARRRAEEAEESARAHEERLTRLYARIKGEEAVRERARKALTIALQLLDEQPALAAVPDDGGALPEGQDEDAAA